VEWEVIAEEPATMGQIVLGYVLPLALVPVICTYVKTRLFGFSVPLLGTTFRRGHGTALSIAGWQYALSLIMVFLFAGMQAFACFWGRWGSCLPSLASSMGSTFCVSACRSR
jgi:hypothetical protein